MFQLEQDMDDLKGDFRNLLRHVNKLITLVSKLTHHS